MNLFCNDNASCDFSNTGAVSFNLPSNVTYTSASGVFGADYSNVPEPGSGPLIFSILVLILGIRVASGALKRRHIETAAE